MADYAKEIDNMAMEQARLDKDVTDCLLLAPKEAKPVCIEAPQDTDEVKKTTDLNPDTLTNDATSVEFRIWTNKFRVLFLHL